MRRRERAAQVLHPRRQRAAAGPAARPTTQNARLMPDTDARSEGIKTHPIAHRIHRLARQDCGSEPRRVASASSTSCGSCASSAARRRIGTSSCSIDSASTFLQSMQPQPAVLHCVATCSTVLGGLNAFVQVIDVAHFGRARIGFPNSLGIGHRGTQLGPDRFGRLEQADRVAHRLRHLRLAVESHDATRRRQQRLRLGKERFALLGAIFRRASRERPNSAFHRRATTRDSSRCCT